jgi:hypothetical protein
MDIRAYAQKRLGINVRSPCSTWPHLDPAQVELYNDGKPATVYPNNTELRLDWEFHSLTPWTKDCATIFANEFCAQHQNGAFPLIFKKITPAEISKMFITYVMYLKRRYHREEKDIEEAKQRKDIADKRSRSLGRRDQVSASWDKGNVSK